MGSLTSGDRLGPYLIDRAIGAGGMGEVYRARDTRLGRDVAIKVLRIEVAKDPDRRARFEREAQAVAALSHPNILAIHDVGSHDGIAYAVTELLEGETLRQRLADGAMPPRKAVEVAVQIAGGLAAAHEKGIVHRDLKPENVFVTRDGRAKILDFGLAALLPTSARDVEQSPTTSRLTEPGHLLGTVGYMSPEQVRGARIDHRTDIFALGAVLFEMLTGRRPFQRETAAETMTAILRDEVPELSTTGGQIPAPLDRLVRRCLEKHADERLQAARDVAIALEAVSGTDVSGATGIVEPATIMRGWRRLALGAAVLFAAASVGYVAATMRAPAAVSAELPRFQQLTFRRGTVRTARFVPDGQSIVYSAYWDGEPQRVYAVRLDRPRAAATPVTDAALLAVSRTGDMAIAVRPHLENVFVEPGTLAQIPLGGGAPRELLENVIDADFAPDGRVAVVRSEGGRTRLELPIGTVLYQTAGWLSSPRVSPNGKLVAFHEHPVHEDDRGWPTVVDVATRVKRHVAEEQVALSGLAWTPDSEAVCYAHVTSISCARIGTPSVRLVVSGAHRVALHDIASDGRMLAEASRFEGRLLAGEMEGREVDLSWQDGGFPIEFSPDGSRLLFGTADYGILLRPLDGGPPVSLAEGIATGNSPDGRSILAFTPGVPTTITIVPTGPGATRALPRGSLQGHTWAVWMPDGRHVVISATEPGHAARLYLQDTLGGEPRAISAEGVRLMASLPGVVSPDGRLVIAIGPDEQPALYPIAGGDPRPIPALGSDLLPLGWGASPQIIFARRRAFGRLIPLFKIDLANGRRQLLKEIGPTDATGAPLVYLVQVSRDGRRYAYSAGRSNAAVFLVEGVKP
jgi:Tol biopolymer transport system component